jgi:hypothetical protein
MINFVTKRSHNSSFRNVDEFIFRSGRETPQQATINCYYWQLFIYELSFLYYIAKAKYKNKLAAKSKVSKRYLHTHVHSISIHSSQRGKQPGYLLIPEWKSKMWSRHTIQPLNGRKCQHTLYRWTLRTIC